MKEWKNVKLGDVVSIKSGLLYKSEFIGKGDNLLLGMGCVSYKENFLDSGVRPYSQDCDPKYMAAPGDLVLATRQQSDNLPILAMPAIIPDKYQGKKIIIGTNLYRVENNSDIENKFLFFVLKSHDYVNYIRGVKTGTTVQMVSKRNVEEYHFLCPPKETRKRIATILSRYDSLIENYQKQIKLLEESAQRLYKEWFIDLRFPEHENTKIVDGVPEGWEKKKLTDIAELKAGGDKPGIVSDVRTEDCAIPIFSNGTTNEGLYGFTKVPEIIEHCVTISARGSVGYTVLRRTPFVPIVRLISVIPHNIYVGYIFFYLKSTTLDSNGAAQQQITIPMIRNKEITIPSKGILEIFESQTEPIFNQIDILKSQIHHLTEARDRLLPKLMSGEIEV